MLPVVVFVLVVVVVSTGTRRFRVWSCRYPVTSGATAMIWRIENCIGVSIIRSPTWAAVTVSLSSEASRNFLLGAVVFGGGFVVGVGVLKDWTGRFSMGTASGIPFVAALSEGGKGVGDSSFRGRTRRRVSYSSRLLFSKTSASIISSVRVSLSKSM